MVIENEITVQEIVIATIVLLIFGIIMTFLLLIPFIRTKIHSSFHKGYKEARDDKHNYYETIRILETDFNKLFDVLKISNKEFSFNIIELLSEFKSKLKKFKQKY